MMGVIQVLAAFSIYSITDVIGKYLMDVSYSVETVIMMRNLLGAFILIAVLYINGGFKGFRSKHPWAHIIRGGLTIFLAYAATISFKLLPMAQAYVIIFSAPFFTVLFGRLLFKEKMTFSHIAVMVVGFFGVVIAADLQNLVFNLGVIAAILTAVSFAAFSISSRYVDRNETPLLLGIYAMLPTGLFALGDVGGDVVRLFEVSDFQLMLFLTMGIIGGAATILHSRGFQNAPARLVASMHYIQLIWGALFDWLVWDHLPDQNTVIGGAVIILAGLYLIFFVREKEPVLSQP